MPKLLLPEIYTQFIGFSINNIKFSNYLVFNIRLFPFLAVFSARKNKFLFQICRLFIYLLSSFFFLNTGSYAADVRALIEPRYDSDEYYSETFTIFADIDDGQYLYGQIGISNLGPGDNNGLCRIMIYNPRNKTLNKSVVIKNSNWKFTKSPVQKLTVGSCHLTLKNNGHLLFKGKLDNITLNILLTSPAHAQKLPNHTLRMENGYYQSEIMVPWSKAITSKNADKIKREGYGYADHSISTLLPSQIADQWLRFRAINNGSSVIMLIRYPTEKSKPQGWLWHQNSSAEIIANVKKSASRLPTFDIKVKTKTVKITANSLIFRQAPLEEKGILGKILAKIMGNPVTYTYRASMLTHTGETLSGILEVAFADE